MAVVGSANAALSNPAQPATAPAILINHSQNQTNNVGKFSSTAAVHAVTTVNHSNSVGSSLHPFSQTGAVSGIDLNSPLALFPAGSLAGFHQITLVIGGKETQIDFSSKLSSSELVAAQQVLGGGKQELLINSSGSAAGARGRQAGTSNQFKRHRIWRHVFFPLLCLSETFILTSAAFPKRHAASAKNHLLASDAAP